MYKEGGFSTITTVVLIVLITLGVAGVLMAKCREASTAVGGVLNDVGDNISILASKSSSDLGEYIITLNNSLSRYNGIYIRMFGVDIYNDTRFIWIVFEVNGVDFVYVGRLADVSA